MKSLIIFCDVLAIGGIVGALVQILPIAVGTIGALLGCVWYGIMIHDRLKHGPTSGTK